MALARSSCAAFHYFDDLPRLSDMVGDYSHAYFTGYAHWQRLAGSLLLLRLEPVDAALITSRLHGWHMDPLRTLELLPGRRELHELPRRWLYVISSATSLFPWPSYCLALAWPRH